MKKSNKRKVKKKKPKYNQNSQIRSAIRRTFSRSPMVQEVKKSARTEHDQFKKDGTLAKRKAIRYKCVDCSGLFKGVEIAVDHIIPVIPTDEEFKDWNGFVNRLFCDKDNLQILCSYKLKDVAKHNNEPSCHHKKTQQERKERKANKL